MASDLLIPLIIRVVGSNSNLLTFLMHLFEMIGPFRDLLDGGSGPIFGYQSARRSGLAATIAAMLRPRAFPGEAKLNIRFWEKDGYSCVDLRRSDGWDHSSGSTPPLRYGEVRHLQRGSDGKLHMNIMVIDVGGHHVKILVTGQEDRREFESGPEMTAREMVDGVKKLAEGREFDVVSLGYPGPTLRGRPLAEPKNLGTGWVGFDYEGAFGCPVKLINDAAMQAVGELPGRADALPGTWHGARLGDDRRGHRRTDGTGPFVLIGKRHTSTTSGERGLQHLGKKRWRHRVTKVVEDLRNALEPTDVVIGGGNAKKLKDIAPMGARIVDNANAFSRADSSSGRVTSSIQTSSLPTHGAGRTSVERSQPRPARVDPEKSEPSRNPSGD